MVKNGEELRGQTEFRSYRPRQKEEGSARRVHSDSTFRSPESTHEMVLWHCETNYPLSNVLSTSVQSCF